MAGAALPIHFGRFVIALVALTALAGCMTSDTDRVTDAAAPHRRLPEGSPAPSSISWNACTVHGATFPAPMDALRPHLAEGLEPVAYPGVPGAPGDPSGRLGAWTLSSHVCDEGTDLWVFIPVTPSQELAGDASFWSVPMRIVTNNAITAATMTAWRIDVLEHDPGVAFELNEDAPGVRTERTSATLPGGPAELTTNAAGFTEQGPRTSRTFAVQNSTITSIVDFTWGDHLQSAPGQGAVRAAAPPFEGVSAEADGVGFQGSGADYTITHLDPNEERGEAA